MTSNEEKYLGNKKIYNGEIAQTIELAEEAKDTREMISIIIHGNKKEFLAEKNAKKIEISEQRNNDKYDFTDLGIGEY